MARAALDIFEVNPARTAAECLASLLNPAGAVYEPRADAQSRSRTTPPEYSGMLAGLPPQSASLFRAKYMNDALGLADLQSMIEGQSWAIWLKHADPRLSITIEQNADLVAAAIEDVCTPKGLPAVRIRRIMKIGESRWIKIEPHYTAVCRILYDIDHQINQHLRKQFRG